MIILLRRRLLAVPALLHRRVAVHAVPQGQNTIVCLLERFAPRAQSERLLLYDIDMPNIIAQF